MNFKGLGRRGLSTIVLALGALAGCGPAGPTAGDSAKKITWAEYQQMDAEQRDDPYVLDNLDDAAKKSLAESQRKKRR